MFALLNPYNAHKKKAKRRKEKARKPRFSSIFTPGGGKIVRHRFNPFLGINPKSRRGTPTFKPGVKIMAKRRSRRGRSVRFNMGSALSAPRLNGLKGSLSLKNLTGIAPIFAGVLVNGLSTNFFSQKIPYTKKGIGNIVLGTVSAGLLGMATKAVTKNKAIGDSMFIGGVVGVLGCAFQNLTKPGGGFKEVFGLGDDMEGFEPSAWSEMGTNQGFQGMGNFTTPQGVANAIPTESSMNQYSLPTTNAQFVPQAAMQMPHTVNQGHHARHMADHEGEALGAMMAGVGENDGYNF